MATNRTLRSALAVLAIALATLTAHARIGETPQECANRYGPPVKQLEGDQVVYKKSGLGVVVTFFNGKAAAIAYRKISEDALGQPQAMSDNEIELLLKSNSGDSPWTKLEAPSMDRQWENGQLYATYITFKNILIVATKDHLERVAAQKARNESKNLDGF